MALLADIHSALAAALTGPLHSVGPSISMTDLGWTPANVSCGQTNLIRRSRTSPLLPSQPLTSQGSQEMQGPPTYPPVPLSNVADNLDEAASTSGVLTSQHRFAAPAPPLGSWMHLNVFTPGRLGLISPHAHGHRA